MSAISKVYINGKVVAKASAKISVFDSGLCYGYGLFETMKFESGRMILFKEHIERLKRGAKELGIKTPPKKELEEAIAKLILANRLAKKCARLKIMLTAGEITFGRKSKAKPTLIITTEEVDTAEVAKRLEKGVSAVTLKAPEFALREATSSHIKNLNYLPSILGRAHAAKLGAFEGLFISKDGRVMEGTASNVFIVKGSRVLTPPLLGILPGVTRGAILGISDDIREAKVTLKALLGADEAFLTGSVSGVVPLIMIDGVDIGNGTPGPVTRSLRESYSDFVAKNSLRIS